MPWHLGHRNTDALIDYAYREARKFEISQCGDLWRVKIGGRPVGLLQLDDLDLVSWPVIDRPFSPGDLHQILHEVADHVGTFAKCYFVGGDEGPVKIGYSVSVADRLKAMQAHSPVVLKVLATTDGGEAREVAYHAQFGAHRLHGEWFTRCPEIEAEIERLTLMPVSPARVALAVNTDQTAFGWDAA